MPQSGSPPSPARAARSFADVDYGDALARARDLVPFLREQAVAVEAGRGLTPAVLDALHRSGLLRCLQPRAWGGMELAFTAYYDVPEMLARGDASVAWVVANLASHHRGLALYDPRAQEEVWGEDPDALIASGIAFQQGRAVRVDGGVLLSGTWNFSSGVDVAGWNMLACVVREAERPVDYLYCLVPARDYTVVDDWHTLGMRGTGSRSVRVEELFVPDHRALSMHVARAGHAWPGARIHTNPMYRISTPALGGHTIAACMVGNARAALEASIALIEARSTGYTGARMRDFQTVQLRVGEAGARIAAADALLRNDLLEITRAADAGETPDTAAKLRFKRNCAFGARLSLEAVDTLHALAGAHGIYETHPIARMYRDARAAAGHISFSLDAQLTNWAGVALGGAFASPTL